MNKYKTTQIPSNIHPKVKHQKINGTDCSNTHNLDLPQNTNIDQYGGNADICLNKKAKLMKENP